MKTYTMSEAKTNLSALVEEAERGEQVVIMRGSKPAAVLMPVSEDQLTLAPMGMNSSLNGAVAYAPSTLPVFEIGMRAYDERLARDPALQKLGERKGWTEIAVVVNGPLKEVKSPDLLDTLLTNHPRMSGWPVWIDSRVLGDLNAPRPFQTGWQALVCLDAPPFVSRTMVDFWRLETNGHFYYRRTYQDDVTAKLPSAQHGKVIDFTIAISLVAEALGTALVLAQNLSANPSESSMTVSVRWSNLADRTLRAWSGMVADWYFRKVAYEDNASSDIQVPLAADKTLLAPQTETLIQPLLSVFGASIPSKLIQEIATDVLKRRPM